MNIKEMKQKLLDVGMKIEKTGVQGQYRVTSSDGTWYNLVRFANKTEYSPAYVKTLKLDVDGDVHWENNTLEGFIEMMEG